MGGQLSRLLRTPVQPRATDDPFATIDRSPPPHIRVDNAGANETTGQDLTAQVGLDFQHGPAALTAFT
ncbi:hypothetical protein [Streptomyces sp. NPDC051572]|uniref:hypothetical protein n=1 Tax=unclassified Streptomyces TaxID=2593676 RepID=UPI00344DB0B6